MQTLQKYEMKLWNFRIYKVLNVLCVRVAFHPVFENFLEAIGEKTDERFK